MDHTELAKSIADGILLALTGYPNDTTANRTRYLLDKFTDAVQSGVYLALKATTIVRLSDKTAFRDSAFHTVIQWDRGVDGQVLETPQYRLHLANGRDRGTDIVPITADEFAALQTWLSGRWGDNGQFPQKGGAKW